MSHETGNAFEVMHDDPIVRVELALDDLRAGRMVVLVDDEDRENEGDLVLAGECVTPEAINFMATHARGLICLSLTADQVERLGLSMMATNNQSAYNTAFTVSIEAREGVTTGISAADRAQTTKVAIDPNATPRSIVTPGHVFPLRARDGGVLERVGQTEGSVDLARLAGLNPSGVICEIMNPDGSMSRLPDLLEFGARHNIRIVAVADIIKFRLRTERMVSRVADGNIEVEGLGTFHTRLYQGIGSGGRHLAVWRGALGREPSLCRVQSAPPAWSLLDGNKSALATTMRGALEAIASAGCGALVLMHLGPSAGVIESQFVEDFGGSPLPLPLPQARADALRDLGTGCQILLDLGMRELRLLTRSSRSIVGLEAYGLRIVERVATF
ncbi:MAG: 3,4-dihydroxy 2-butanone 4-phosphate synthase/GTP cyclohydrolase II [Myxococcota bacterium]